LNLKLDLLRDRTRAVAERYQNGVYVVGRAGTGKTFTIVETLKRLDAPWAYRNGRVSAAGLFALLQEHPEHTVVLDDVTSLMGNKDALQVLIAALGGEPGQPRTVTYTIKSGEGRQSFEFRGGVVAVSNLPLRRDPLVDGVQSRVPLLEHEPSDEQLAAFMRQRAAKGFEDLSPAECGEVVEYLIAESRAADYRLDLRAMSKAWQDRRLAKHGKAKRPWQELVASMLKRIVPGHTGAAGTLGGREAARQRDLDVARDLLQRFPSAADKAVYRRCRELKNEPDGREAA
jgi:hypothetical protein